MPESRKRIAFFTPLPPMQSGIADFSVDILSRLSRHFCIDVFTDRYSPNPLELDNVKTFVYTCFEQKATEYDEIVYQVGNARFHTYMFDFIKKYPGIVELHDLNLSDVVNTEFFAENHICESLFQILCEDFSVDVTKKYIAATLGHQNFEAAELNGFAVNYAKSVIVHSEYAKKSLLKKNPKLNVLKIPLYSIVESDKSRLKKTEKRKNLGICDADIVIAVFGFIHWNKRIISTLKAFAMIKSAQKNAVLHFVGKLSPDLADEFWKSVKRLNLQNSVFVTGFTTLEKFNDYMDAADICLNLRYPYNGENSASLTRLLGKGKCVIVNRIGSFAEIPENCCIMIDGPENMSAKEEVDVIASAIERAMNGKTRLQIEDNAAKFAKENLDLDLLENQYVAAIENASIQNDFSIHSAEIQPKIFELTEWGKKYENFCKRWRIFFKIRSFFRWLKKRGIKVALSHTVECVFKRSKA